MYLAKSYPIEESIVDHTENLIYNLKILKNIYKDNIRVNWDLLELACLYHDIGKVNRIFQSRIKGEYIDTKFPNIPHGYLSIMFINYKELIQDYNLSKSDIVILINVVAHHHKREKFNEDMINIIKNYQKYLEEDISDFKYSKLPNIQDNLNSMSLYAVNKSGISGFSLNDVGSYIILKGLLNKIDYAASGHYQIEYPNDFLIDSMKNLKDKWGEDAEFNDLQDYMIDNRDENIVAIAETGYGKTEAGLLWIGNNKGFFTLPLKSAINQTYERISKDIILENIEEKVGLLHSDTLSEYVERNKNILNTEILDYQEITNELSMPLTICTIDQIFDFVYKYVGFERKLATLSYSKIVIDEIQMYSPDLVAYIIIALDQINRLGGRFSIITATFPPFIKDLLTEHKINFKMPKPFLYNNRIRHSIKILEEEINSEFIFSKYRNNKVLVIVNTVKKLNELYDDLVDRYKISDDINVFHSGFTKRDRMRKEREIIQFGGKNNTDAGIWICTQVAEASLDIDFDILITELSDLNGLFQRMGRCYRNRNLDLEYNIYVFDGGDKLPSGIGYVNDRDIFDMSKKILRLHGDGKIDEEEKISLINKIYTTEALENTEYYRQILQTISYINSINYDEFKKKDVIKYFRNINSVDVIPRPLYEKNYKKINRLVEILSDDKGIKNKKEMYLKKKKARLDLDKYKLAIPHYMVNDKNIEIKFINKYDYISIYSCQYSSRGGIEHLKEDIEDEDEEVDMFF